MSRVHCRLTVAPDAPSKCAIWRIRNGTFVNGERIEKARLKSSGDRLGVGRIELVALRDEE